MAIEVMIGDDFVMKFKSEFAPVIKVQQLEREFQDLRQTTESVAKITTILREMALLVMQYVVDEETKKARYHDKLKDEIREFMNMSSCKILEDTIAWAREQEIDLDAVTKRKLVQTEVLKASRKKPKVVDLCLMDQ